MTMRFIFALLLLLPAVVLAAEPQKPIPLWPKGAPGALGTRPEDIPTLTAYLPSAMKASGTAIVICPGGGYANLSSHEGDGYARWLSDHGVVALVLKYRLGSQGYRHPAMLDDVTRALRMVRDNAVKLKVDSARIGVMGSSAGGHLASTLLTHFDAGNAAAADPIERQSSRPDFGILCYPVISGTASFTHAGSMANLLGPHPAAELLDFLSSEKQVRDDTPPCFIWTTFEDQTVPPANSLAFAEALLAHHVPFDLHVYEKGRHGLGLGKSATDPSRLLPWTDDLLYWLGQRGLLKK